MQVASIDGQIAGYLTVVWCSDYLPFRDAGIPEIVDVNVFPKSRRRGVARALITVAERLVRTRSDTIGIGVGLGAEYGPAQQLYVRIGFVPAGRGLMYNGEPVDFGESILVDDSATLMPTKGLRAGGSALAGRRILVSAKENRRGTH